MLRKSQKRSLRPRMRTQNAAQGSPGVSTACQGGADGLILQTPFAAQRTKRL